jgi:hypothetical protein
MIVTLVLINVLNVIVLLLIVLLVLLIELPYQIVSVHSDTMKKVLLNVMLVKLNVVNVKL